MEPMGLYAESGTQSAITVRYGSYLEASQEALPSERRTWTLVNPKRCTQ